MPGNGRFITATPIVRCSRNQRMIPRHGTIAERLRSRPNSGRRGAVPIGGDEGTFVGHRIQPAEARSPRHHGVRHSGPSGRMERRNIGLAGPRHRENRQMENQSSGGSAWIAYRTRCARSRAIRETFGLAHGGGWRPAPNTGRAQCNCESLYTPRGEKCDVLGREGEPPCEPAGIGEGSDGASPSQNGSIPTTRGITTDASHGDPNEEETIDDDRGETGTEPHGFRGTRRGSPFPGDPAVPRSTPVRR